MGAAVSSDFGAKLAFLLKSLTLSNGRLAADLAVDKSVVGRWVRGAVAPSAHNLGLLTHHLAKRRPGLTLLDWELPLERFIARFGPEQASGAADDPLDVIGLREWAELGKLQEAARSSATSTRATDGFWRAIAPVPGMPGQLGQSFSMISPGEGGASRVETGFYSLRRIGWALRVGNQTFTCVAGVSDGLLSFTICNVAPGDRVEVMDGLFLGCFADNGGTPVAMPIVLDRIGELLGDAAADAAELDRLLGLNPLLDPASVADSVRQRLASAAAIGSAEGGALLMPALTSLAMSRSQT